MSSESQERHNSFAGTVPIKLIRIRDWIQLFCYIKKASVVRRFYSAQSSNITMVLFRLICFLVLKGFSYFVVCDGLVKRSFNYNLDKAFYYANHPRFNASLSYCEIDIKCIKNLEYGLVTIPMQKPPKTRHHLGRCFIFN